MKNTLIKKHLTLKSILKRQGALVALLLALSGSAAYLIVRADNTAQTIPFSQNWSNNALITANNDWSGVPGIIGYRGDALVSGTGVDPQTVLVDGTATPVNVNANQTTPNTFTTGGVTEFQLANSTIALAGSGTARAPFILINLNTTGVANVNVAYNLRDLEDGTDNAIQPVALQYRVGSSGNFTNLPAGFVADATDGPSIGGRVTPVSVTLPAATGNQPLVQVRIITTDAVGSDEWVGVDDISITGAGGNQPIITNCPASVTTLSGTAASGNVSASDPDGTITSATISSITPSNPGSITLGSFTPAAATGGTATATLNVGAATPQNIYTVTITWANNDSPTPQTATCAVTATVNSSGPTLISAIQGTAETPNLSGQLVNIQGIVVGDFQGAGNLNGFFVEEEESDWDANANTSEGIFVFAPSAPDVSVGDQVTVTGAVANFPVNPGLTELINVTNVVVNSTGNALPAAQTVTLPVTTSPAADLEKYEGMRVTFGTLVVTDNRSLGQFGELTLATEKLFIPTNSIDPNDNPASGNSISGSSNVAAVTAQQALNDKSRITLDDGKTGSNPNPIPFIGAGTNSTIRLGDTVSNLAGVLSFAFSTYRIEPTSPPNFTAANPRPSSPGAVGASTLRVASFNVENYFVTTGTGRGPDNPAEQIRKRDKVVAAIAGLNADVVGLIELEKGTQATASAAQTDIVNALNALGAVGTYAVIPTPAAVYDATSPVGTDTDIKSGIIYRISAVTPFGSSLTDTTAAVGTYSRAPIAQTFQQNSNGAKFTIVVNHLRSKSCSGGSGGDADQNDGQACFNARRRSQSQALVSFINNTLIPIDPDVIAVGDFNAYGQEDPIDVLRAANMADLIGQFVPAASQYSFTFQAQVGRLDHAFTTSSLTSQATGARIWYINSDEPAVFDYNTESKPDDRYAATPYRSADHDPFVVGLKLDCPEITVSPATLPNATNGNAYNQIITAGGVVAPVSFAVTAGALPDGLTLTSAGVLSGTPTKPGLFNFTVTASGGGNCSSRRGYSLAVNQLTASIADPLTCLGPGGVVRVSAAVTNSNASAQPASFTAMLPAKLLALPGTCTANVGTCTVVSASSVTWSGTLAAGQTVSISYQAQVGDGVIASEQLCVTSKAVVDGSAEASVTACTNITCPPVTTGNPLPTNSPTSGQRAGSVLIYNIYTSSTDSNRQNTRLSITNIEPARKAYMHLFFVDGSSCVTADQYICLTPNQTSSFLASDLDPGTTGFLIAIAVDANGCPVNFNYLIGDEYVKFASGHAANLGAQAITAIAGGLPACNAETSMTATLNFDGVSYSGLPHVLAVDSLPSRADGNETLLVLNRIGGNLATGAGTLGTIFGILYDDAETGISFGVTAGNCQLRGIISNSFPRTTPRFEQFVPAGLTGWMKLWQAGGTLAMTGAVINFNANAAASGGAFNQGHNLHVLTTTNAMSLSIPVFPPGC